jgi:hypothetical protein
MKLFAQHTLVGEINALAIEGDKSRRSRAQGPRAKLAETRKLKRLILTTARKFWVDRPNYRGYRYYLAMHVHQSSETTVQSPSSNLRSGQTAKSGQTVPQSLRYKPSIEPPYKHSNTKPGFEAAEGRLRAFQEKQEPIEVIQNRIAQRIGDDGWLVLGDMNDHQRTRLTKLERQRKLDEETLHNVVLATRFAARK